MTNSIIFVGDVHAEFDTFSILEKANTPIIQVGDFGMGFATRPHLKDTTRYIRGNHDYPKLCREDPNWIKDGHVELIGDTKFMFVGGGLSIDKEWRTEGLDWWPDEEVTYQEMLGLIDIYEAEKPDVMVTHATATSIARQALSSHGRTFYGLPSVTEQGLETMLGIHRPKLWVFGHYHVKYREEIDGTTFCCIPPLDILEIEFT